jgi:predicted nucleic acid-binding protein
VTTATAHALCDTSVASLVVAGAVPDSWPRAERERLAAAIQAISLVTVAEIRRGAIQANWGPRRLAGIDDRLAAYLWVSVDVNVAYRWADLAARAKGAGIALSDNDLWIAATAIELGWPLATSDRDHQRLARIDGVALDLLWLPR